MTNRVVRAVPDIANPVVRAVPDVAHRVVPTMASDRDPWGCDRGARRDMTNPVVRTVPDVTGRVIGAVPGMAHRVIRAVPDVARWVIGTVADVTRRVIGTMASEGDSGRCDRGARRNVTNQVIRTVPGVTQRVIRTVASHRGAREGGLQHCYGTSTQCQRHRGAHSQLLHPVALGHRLDLPARRSPAPCGRSTFATGLGACR